MGVGRFYLGRSEGKPYDTKSLAMHGETAFARESKFAGTRPAGVCDFNGSVFSLRL